MPARKAGRRKSPTGEASTPAPSDGEAKVADARLANERGPRRGDVMSVEKRSALMSRIRGKDTKPERAVAAAIRDLGLEAETHVRELPGRPDFVFRSRRVAIFVDGDFWHGWRFPQWSHKLAPFWAEKIGQNRARDLRNFQKLRRAGWTVVRIWEHQIKRSPEEVARRLKDVLAEESRAPESMTVAATGTTGP